MCIRDRRYVAELPEDKRKILSVDTEQSPYHCLQVMKRLLRMAGLPDDRDNENLELAAFNNLVIGIALIINHQFALGLAGAIGLSLGAPVPAHHRRDSLQAVPSHTFRRHGRPVPV